MRLAWFTFALFTVGCARGPRHDPETPSLASALASHESQLGVPAGAPVFVEGTDVGPQKAAAKSAQGRGRRGDDSVLRQ
jgi:hypothetical protein